MHLSQHKLCAREMELPRGEIFSPIHWVTRPWRRTLTNGSDVKNVCPRRVGKPLGCASCFPTRLVFSQLPVCLDVAIIHGNALHISFFCFSLTVFNYRCHLIVDCPMFILEQPLHHSINWVDQKVRENIFADMKLVLNRRRTCRWFW